MLKASESKYCYGEGAIKYKTLTDGRGLSYLTFSIG